MLIVPQLSMGLIQLANNGYIQEQSNHSEGRQPDSLHSAGKRWSWSIKTMIELKHFQLRSQHWIKQKARHTNKNLLTSALDIRTLYQMAEHKSGNACRLTYLVQHAKWVNKRNSQSPDKPSRSRWDTMGSDTTSF